jgi:hypothetical protein
LGILTSSETNISKMPKRETCPIGGWHSWPRATRCPLSIYYRANRSTNKGHSWMRGSHGQEDRALSSRQWAEIQSCL